MGVGMKTIDDSFDNNNLVNDNISVPTSLLLIDGNDTLSSMNIVSSNSIESDDNLYDQSNKLSRRVRRLLKPTCSVAVLPNIDVIILDCEQNLVLILDKRGIFKYCFTSDIRSDEQKTFNVNSFSSTATVSSLPAGSNRTVRIPTQQGLLSIKSKKRMNV